VFAGLKRWWEGMYRTDTLTDGREEGAVVKKGKGRGLLVGFYRSEKKIIK
jgi:hypothetical protein